MKLQHPLEQEAGVETAGGGTVEKKPTKKEKPKVVVQMTDGRSVEFPEDTKAKKTILVAGSDGRTYDKGDTPPEGVTLGSPVGVRWDFSNGQTRAILLSEVEPLRDHFTVHGISQKGGDEYASEKDVDDAVEAFDDLRDRLLKGEWSERREGGFGGVSVLAKAIAEVFGKTPEEVRAFLRDLKPAEKMALRQSAELKPVIERIEAEKASGSKVDTGALLGKLTGATA